VFREVRDWFEELACRAGLDGLPSPRRMLGVGVALVLAAVLGWTLWGGPAGQGAAVAGEAPAAPAAVATSTAPALPETVTVHVVGEVRRPGVYELPAGSRARDAVDAAGGLLGAAEQEAVNLARVLTDGEQLTVPRHGAVPAASAAGPGGAPAAGGKVDLNTATAAELDTLPGVGPSTAAKIVADRTSNGPFRSVDDLMRVSGIGPAKFDALKDLVRVD
jgi:competence protein ComEA